MIQDFSQLFNVVAGTSLIFGVLFLIYRKHILHLFDPLLYYLVAQSFSIELAFLTIDDTAYLINFLSCQIFFVFGFFSFAGKGLQKADLTKSIFFRQTDNLPFSVIKWYSIFALAVIVVANLILIKITGIALFSDDPSAAKVDNFTEGGGLGIIRRINWGMLYLVGLTLIILFMIRKSNKYVFLFLLLLLVPTLSGSKGALLYFIFAVTLLSCFNDIKSSGSFLKLRLGSYVLLLLAVFLSAIIVSGSNSDEGLNDKLFKLATRFLYFGDSIIYYYNHDSVHYFAKYNFTSFFKDELNPVLGFFRLVPYQQPMGFRLINHYFNIDSKTFGPNTPYYIKGNIYFGYYGAFIYSFIIGSVIGFVRNRFYSIVKNGAPLLYAILILHLNLVIYTLAQDSQLFTGVLFDTIIISIPAFVVSVYLHFSKKESLI
ncbi:MAG: O-antigen polymerase [Panacibacter sp.]